MAVSSTQEKPPQTHTITTIIVIQVDAVTGCSSALRAASEVLFFAVFGGAAAPFGGSGETARVRSLEGVGRASGPTRGEAQFSRLTSTPASSLGTLSDPATDTTVARGGSAPRSSTRIPNWIDTPERLTIRAVSDNQLALPASDRDHGVDRLQTGLERLDDRLAIDDARRLELERPALVRLDGAGAVERSAEWVDDSSDQRIAHGHTRDPPAALHDLAFGDPLPFAEQRHADVVFFQVERQPGDAVLELEHLHRKSILEPVDTGDAVADLKHGPDLGEVGLDVVLLDSLLEDRGDLFRT